MLNSSLDESQQVLVESNVIYARRLARRFHQKYHNRCFDYEDYEGAAFLGLCDAAKRYDPTRKELFRTFAFFRVQGAMFDMLRHESGIQRREYSRIIKSKQEAENNKYTRLPFSFASSIQDLTNLLTFIDKVNLNLQTTSDGSLTFTYAEGFDPEQEALIQNSRNYLIKLIQQLPDKQQEVINLRYFQGKTFNEIGEALGRSSKSWISRLHTDALDNLRQYVAQDKMNCDSLLQAQDL